MGDKLVCCCANHFVVRGNNIIIPCVAWDVIVSKWHSFCDYDLFISLGRNILSHYIYRYERTGV